MVIKHDRLKKILTEEALKDFYNFMAGQTVAMDGVYEDDFMRWVYKLPVVD